MHALLWIRVLRIRALRLCKQVASTVPFTLSCSMQAHNAFCAIRPPGHHSGPRGVVGSVNEPVGSHGFCLLNNLAIGAAYALNVHRSSALDMPREPSI